jgi:hypothetical protein
MKGLLIRRVVTPALLVAGVAATVLASDHQDTPEVELSPRMDINDVYAFPGEGADRIALAMTTSSPIVPGMSTTTARFDPNLLYQFKIDNSAPLDGVEDLVIQVRFENTAGGGQTALVYGPLAPPARLAPDGTPITPPLTGSVSALAQGAPAVSGSTGIPITGGAENAIKLFAGTRDDPFFLDLEQFFRIIPDRKPVSGPLSQLPETPTASGFRSTGAVDYLRGVNTLAIVLEMPESLLSPPAASNGRIGVWATISR